MTRREAQTVFLQKYLKLVGHIAGRYAREGIEWDDLVQEGCMALLRAMEQYRDHSPVSESAYVAVCIENAMRRWVNRERRYHYRYYVSEAIPEGVQTRTPLDGIEEREGYLERESQIRDRLSQKEWEILQCLAQGISYAETACRLHIDQKSVDNAIQRIRRKLRSKKSA